MKKIYLILYLLLLETGMLWAQSAIPNVDGVSNQTVCNNGNTTAINFTGLIPNTNYNWINNNTSIGLAANGTGNIGSFKAINTGIFPVTASITVTPVIIETQTKTFNYTGAMQTWTVPNGVTSIMIETYGASGSNGAPGGNNANGGTGGLGAKASGELAVTPGQVLNIFVGGKGTVGNGGFNGGGNGGNLSAGGGGGGTDIRYPGILPANRIIVAGGGGGGGRGGCESGTVTGGNGGNGGNGNGTDGTNAPTSSGFAGGGFGAIGSLGGLKGVGCSGFLGKDGVAGTVNGVGGNGGDGQNCCCFSAPSVPGGGGGGGGYSGGGGGGGGSAGTVNCTGNDKGGGAGGSGGTSYILGVNNGVEVSGLNAGDGKVLITYSIALSGNPETFNITVNPTPSVTATPLVQTICSGTAISTISMTNNINGTTYNWTRDNTVSVTGIAASGTGNINGVLTNMTNAPKNVSFTITPTVDGCVGTPVIANVIVPAKLVVTKNGQTNISCNEGTNGSVAVNVTGGVAPYTYVWNNGITSTTNEATNLAAGTYEVTVTDANGCELTESFTITEPDVININLQQTSFNTCSTCNESDLVATITGGTAPYTYLWNDGVTTKDRNDLLNGTYTLTVTDANGCTASKNIVVSTTVELPYRDFTYTNGNAVSELNNFTTCQSGAIVKANSGSYTNGVWYVGSYELFVNNISLGIFTGEQTIDISNYIPITSVRAVGNHNFWSWTSIDVKTYSDIVHVPPTTPIVNTVYYELNSTATPLTATLNSVGTTLKWYSDELGSDYSANAPTPLTNQLGTTSYYVSQANSVGCESKRAKIDVIVVSPITYTHQIDDLLCFNSTGSIDLSVSGGTGSYTYLWSNGAITEDITVVQGGNYTCTITDENSGFSITTQVFQVLQPLQLQATVASINVACLGGNNGEATATATDGTAPYTYLWNDINNQTTQTATGLVAGTYQVTVTDANACIITETVTITEPTALQSTPTQVNVLCHGESTGSATLVISGGVAPYTYVWNNGITSTTNEATNLASGIYEVTVTDANGCIITETFTITEPTALQSTPTQVNVLCHGESTGSATVVILGGVAPYTYVWNNGITSTTNEATNLAAGTYEVTVIDANGCIIRQSFTITQPTALQSVPSQVDVLCHGASTGSATVVISGGVAPYTYVWNNGITSTTNEATNLVAGMYEVTVTDTNGCIITETLTITEPTALQSTPTQVNVLCHGNATGSATVVISGGMAPYTYLWNNGIVSTTNEATNLAAGTYEVTVTDANGCIITEAFTITEPAALNSTPTQVNVLCHGESTGSATVVISGGVAPYTYVWNNGITSTTNEATNLASGIYEVTVTDANGCIITEAFTITEPTALQSTPTQVNVLCHGESTGTATVVISGGVAPYTYVWSNGITSTTNEATNLAAGTYEVTATDANGCIITESFTITEPTALKSAPSQVNVLCHGELTGSATVVISGGVAPYTYVWNNGITSTTNEATNLAAGTYEVRVTDANGCIITEAFTVTEPPLVLAPLSHNQEFCIGDLKTVNDLVAVGSNLKWYLSQYAQTPVQPAALLTSGMYYGTQTVNGCESKSRVEIKVTVHDTPAPTAIAVQYFCANEVSLIEDLLVMGTDILWYDTPIGGSPLNPLASLSNNTIYYASQKLNGCESLTRTAVSVVIHPVNTITTSAIAVCSNTTIGNITIDNYNAGQLKWYDAAIAGNELSSATMVSNGIYYVSTFTNNTCISDRQPLQVVVLAQVAVPTVGMQVFCGSAEVKDLPVQTIFGGILKWYSSSTATIPLTANTSLGNGTYYVEQTIGQCSSLRTAVAVKVVSLTAPILNNAVLCHGATVDDIPANQNPSVKYLWFADSTTTVPLKGGDVLATGQYYAAFTQNGCISNRTSVYITVNPKPAKPTGSIVQTFSDYAVVADLKMNEKSIAWFDNYSDAQRGINILSQNTVLQDGKDYYAVHVGPNACLSDPVSVKVAIVLGTRGFDLTSLEYYPNPVEHELTIKNADVIKVITVYDILGKQIMQETFNTSELKIDFSGYSEGTYMVRIETVKGSQFVKIIKK